MLKVFYVVAKWDEEAEVFYSVSNIDGLHLEAPTIKEFVKEMEYWAPELLKDNHHIKVSHRKRSKTLNPFSSVGSYISRFWVYLTNSFQPPSFIYFM